jgi:hypothetical protein
MTHSRAKSTPAHRLKRILDQPSFELATPQVCAFVTRAGGMVGPVTFRFGKRTLEPLSVAPWCNEKLDRATPPIIRALRGDFFCMPFGGNTTPYKQEHHPIHGESANENWKLEAHDRTSLHLSLRTRVRRGRIDKRIALMPGQRAIYSQHTISGMSGPMCFGQHAMLKFPDEPASGALSTSPIVYAQVFVEPVERPENRGYSLLKPGAEFDSLNRVPTITGGITDLSRFPARRGYEDLVMLVSDDRAGFAWTAVTFARERYVWFALKDPRVLRSTILWISNGGRHYAPWNGRHINVMGLEEVTSYFHYGLAESVESNALARRGIATSVTLDPKRPLSINYIMAVAEVPRGFDRVARIEREARGVRLIARSGKSARVALDLDILAPRGGR